MVGGWRGRQRVDRRLRTATGKIAFMIYLNKLDSNTLLDLGNLGLKVEVNDEKLMIVFATSDASKLAKVVELPEVDFITPIE